MTTTTEDSGPLKFLLPAFEKTKGMKLRTTIGGMGQMLKFARNGDVDTVLTHSRSDEEKLIEDGFGIARFDVMYNDFVIVLPKEDPARIRGLTDAKIALGKIMQAQATFVSRADESGTHRAEQRLWREAGFTPQGSWYLRTGSGMGEVFANERGGYTLTDRGTLVQQRKNLELELLLPGEPKIPNQYGVIAINPKKYPYVNANGAARFVDWIVSLKGQRHIAEYKIDGQQPFFPNAKLR
ncbi:MAG: substrate-binding domain-containing protein [Burkholderiales bacterium]